MKMTQNSLQIRKLLKIQPGLDVKKVLAKLLEVMDFSFKEKFLCMEMIFFIVVHKD
jgi:hypothetical protein